MCVIFKLILIHEDSIMMKRISLVALAVFVAGHANAVQLIKDDKNDVKLTGLAYAGHFFGDQKNSASYGSKNYLRFGTDASTQIDDRLTAIGKYEAQFQLNNPESEQNFTSTVNSSDNGGSGDAIGTNVRTRVIFGGVKDKEIGSFTFGRQFGAMYATVASWTDVGYTDGYTASAAGTSPDRFGSHRSSDMLKYTGVFGKATVAANYKFNTSRDTSTLDRDNSAYGLAGSYEVLKNFTLGTAYVNGDRAQTSTSANTDNAKLMMGGAKYDDKSLYAALVYAKGTDFLANNVDHTAYETALGYTFTNGIGVLATWEKQNVDNAGVKSEGYNAYTVGSQYAINKNLTIAVEYRLNNLGKDAYAPAAVREYGDYSKTGSTYNSPAVDAANDYQIAVKYLF